MSVDSYIKDLEIGKTLDPSTAVKSLNFNNGLSPATQLENFLLLTTGSRDVSMFFINTVDEIVAAENLARQLGLGFKSRPSFIPDPKGGYHIFLRGFTFTNEEKSKELDSLHPTRSPGNEIEASYRFRPMLHKSIGDILDYPFCCVKTYVEDASVVIDTDERITIQVADYKRKNKISNPDAFYLEEFLPCRPDCENASAKGRIYEKGLRLKVSDAVANLYGQIKLEHLRNVETEKFLRQKESGKKKYFDISIL
jgi:hypothetical protein